MFFYSKGKGTFSAITNYKKKYFSGASKLEQQNSYSGEGLLTLLFSNLDNTSR